MSKSEHCIKNFPVSLFSSVMGFSGLSIAYQRYEALSGSEPLLGRYLIFFSLALFFLLLSTYLFKLLRFTDEVKSEIRHPVRSNFIATISISQLLLSIGFLEINPFLSQGLWVAGTIMHLTFTLFILSRWITHNYEIAHSNPAWFIPIVGNLIVPIAGIHFYPLEISQFFFSIGFFFYLSLFTIVFYRIIFHPQLPEKFIPTLFILIAPPAIGFVSYTKLFNSLDPFALFLFYVAVFFTLLLFSMLPYFFRLRFYISWWAYTFPLCAITIASFAFFKATASSLFFFLGTFLLAISTIMICLVLYKTLKAFYAHTLCKAEE